MDLEWIKANWIVVASAAAGVVLLMVVIVAVVIRGKSGRKGSPSALRQPGARATPAPRSPDSTAGYGIDWSTSTRADWTKPSGDPANVEVLPAGLRVGPGEGAVHAGRIIVAPGTALDCEYEIELATTSSNGKPVNFYVGPVMRDSQGAVVSWWTEQPSFAPGEKKRKGTLRFVAPAGAATAQVGVHGSAVTDGSPFGDGTLLVKMLRLSKD